MGEISIKNFEPKQQTNYELWNIFRIGHPILLVAGDCEPRGSTSTGR